MEKIVLLDGSRRMHNSISIEAIKDIARLRDISVEYHECPNFIDAIVNRSFNPRRNGHNGQGQVHEGAMLQNLDNETKIQRLGNDGKIILFDEDLYDDGLNWCFGGFSGTARGLGYILLSTARLQDATHAKDLVRHELGHMFNAPSEQRRNSGDAYESLGLHCAHDLCVMQQKLSVPESIKYAHQRARLNAPAYCPRCEQDIINFEGR